MDKNIWDIVIQVIQKQSIQEDLKLDKKLIAMKERIKSTLIKKGLLND